MRMRMRMGKITNTTVDMIIINGNKTQKNHVSAGNMMTGPSKRTSGAQSAGNEKRGLVKKAGGAQSAATE